MFCVSQSVLKNNGNDAHSLIRNKATYVNNDCTCSKTCEPFSLQNLLMEQGQIFMTSTLEICSNILWVGDVYCALCNDLKFPPLESSCRHNYGVWTINYSIHYYFTQGRRDAIHQDYLTLKPCFDNVRRFQATIGQQFATRQKEDSRPEPTSSFA